MVSFALFEFSSQSAPAEAHVTSKLLCFYIFNRNRKRRRQKEKLAVKEPPNRAPMASSSISGPLCNFRAFPAQSKRTQLLCLLSQQHSSLYSSKQNFKTTTTSSSIRNGSQIIRIPLFSGSLLRHKVWVMGYSDF